MKNIKKNVTKNTKKNIKPRAKKIPTRKEFTGKYRYLAEQVAEVKKLLMSAKKLARPLARMAYKLRETGDKLYTVGKNKMLVPTFNRLPKMMDNLDWWTSIDCDIGSVHDSI